MSRRIATKRIAGELKQFMNKLPEYISIYPNPDNIMEIYFLMKGEKDSNYEGGEYLGKILYGPKYPFMPPNYNLLTPNGRFHLNKKICLSNSDYHNESWSPAGWNLLTILNAMYTLWHSKIASQTRGIGHLKISTAQIKKYALESKKFNLENYGDIMKNFS